MRGEIPRFAALTRDDSERQTQAGPPPCHLDRGAGLAWGQRRQGEIPRLPPVARNDKPRPRRDARCHLDRGVGRAWGQRRQGEIPRLPPVARNDKPRPRRDARCHLDRGVGVAPARPAASGEISPRRFFVWVSDTRNGITAKATARPVRLRCAALRVTACSWQPVRLAAVAVPQSSRLPLRPSGSLRFQAAAVTPVWPAVLCVLSVLCGESRFAGRIGLSGTAAAR